MYWLFVEIFLFFSEIFSISIVSDRNWVSSSSVSFSIFSIGSILVSLNLLSFNHFSTIATFDLTADISRERSLEHSLNKSNNSTYSSRCSKSIRNFLRFVSVAVRNCRLAFVFWYTSCEKVLKSIPTMSWIDLKVFVAVWLEISSPFF